MGLELELGRGIDSTVDTYIANVVIVVFETITDVGIVVAARIVDVTVGDVASILQALETIEPGYSRRVKSRARESVCTASTYRGFGLVG
jgi:hypothetical protein